MTQVRTNLDNTRERAGQLRFEPEGTISATNVQDAIAEVSASSAQVPPAPVIVAASPYVILPTDVFVFVDVAGAVTLTLPDAATWLAANPLGLPLTIKDISGAAAANNITINRSGADTIDGGTSIVITSDFGGWKLRPPQAGEWAIVG